MPDLPEPISVAMPEPTPAVGHWLARTCRAIFVEHRIPTKVGDIADRLAVRLGSRFRTLIIPDPEGGPLPARTLVRRGTADRFFAEEVFVRRVYSPAGYDIGETDTVVDVGGNIGSFAVFAARRSRLGQVITIEPASDSFELLSRNITRNHLANVRPLMAAVTAKRGPATLHRSAVGTGHHSLDPLLAGSGQTEETDGLTLADVFRQANVETCDMLKLDCEGAEFQILAEMSFDLASRIRRMAIEYHTLPQETKRKQADELATRLIDLGFVIDRYEDHLGTNRGMMFARRQ